MHVRRLLLLVLLAVLTAAPCQANEVCSDALYQELNALVINVFSEKGVSYRQGELAALLTGPFTKFSACANVTDDESTKKLEWLLLPGWHGGYVMDVFRYMATLPSSNLKRYAYLFPDLLPPMSEIRTAADVRSLLSMPTSGAYSFTAEDPATLTPFAFLFDDDVHAARNSKMPMFSELAENSCVSKSAPQGPLHPRMFLTMLYRADALTTMAAAGVIKPDRAIPSDWDGLLEVLEAHQRLVSLLLMQVNTSASRPSLALPRYGLCVNADHTCGRLGDLFAAIAASIVQFNGTRQGYIFDLTLPPPTLKTLFSRPGWRRAAEVLQSLLQYNAPAAANAAAAVETNGTDGEDGPSCHGIGAQVFNTGECLITFEFETSMRMASIMPAIREKLGVAPVPGSREVAAGPGGALVPCTAGLCAVSYNHDLLYLQPTLKGAEAAAAASLAVTPGQISGSDSVPGQGRSPLPVFAAREAVAVARLRQNPGAANLDLPIVNRAPLAVVLDELINVRYSSPANDPITLQDVISIQQALASGTDDGRYTRQTALDALRETVGFGPNSTRGCESYAQGDWWRVLAPSRGNRSASPRPNSASAPNAAGNLSSDLAAVRMPWAAWSGDAALFDTTQWSPDTAGQSAGYFRTVWHALHSPNVAPHPRSPMQINLYRHALSYAAMALLAASYNDAPNANATGGTAIGGGVEVAIAELERAWAVMAEVVDPSTMRAVYEDSIAAPQYVAAQGPPAGNSLRAGEKAAIGAAVGAAGVILLVATVMGLVMLSRRRRRQHRDLFGRVMAPKEGPDTALLITDVQNSTVLWEQLPVEVMDVVLKLHHSTIRSVLARHNGYESATEGDSFILAFATPSAALGFATSCQIELLHQDWPPPLLDHPDGAPVLVLSPHDPTDPNDGHGTSALAALGFIASGGAGSRIPFTAGSTLGQGRASIEPKGSYLYSSNSREKQASRDLDQRSSAGAPRGSSRRLRPSTPGFSSGIELEDDAHVTATSWGDMLAAAFPVLSADSAEGRRVHALLRASTMDTATAEAAAQDEEAGGGARASVESATTFGHDLVLRLPDGRVAVVAYRGLRVRMGLHSGLKDPAQVAFNKVVSSYAYKGDFAELAKLVSDAAPGGLITLSHYAFARLRHKQPVTGSSAADALNGQSSYPNDKQHPHRSSLLSLMSRRGLHQEDRQASQGAVIIYAGAYGLTEPKARGPASPALRSGLTLMLSSAVRPARVLQAPITPSMTQTAPSVTAVGPVAEAVEFSPFTADAAEEARDTGHKEPEQDGTPLETVEEPHALFLAVPPSLLCRLALRPQLRVVRTVKLGSLAAPVRRVTVAFMKVVGAALILSDLPGPGARALEAFQQIAGRLLTPGGGYKVEGADGLVLAVFASPVAALAWACSCITALCQHQWEEALLAHELCQEELGVGHNAAELSGCNAGSFSPGGGRVPSLRRQGCGPLLQAGPRIKVGLDVGTVTHTLTEASGRLSYRGRPMNRAARIAGIGGAGQVLCSGDTWEACGAEEPGLLDRYVGLSLGCMALKGVAQPLEVVQVLPEGPGCG